jgi:hypothetical membrane protein
MSGFARTYPVEVALLILITFLYIIYFWIHHFDVPLNETDTIECFTILSFHLVPPLLPLLGIDIGLQQPDAIVYNGGIVSTSACSCLKATDQIDFSAALLQLVTTSPPPSSLAEKGERLWPKIWKLILCRYDAWHLGGISTR